MSKLFLENYISYQTNTILKLSKKDPVNIKIGESNSEYKERLEYEKIALESINEKELTSIVIPFASLLTALIAICSFVTPAITSLFSTLVKIIEMKERIKPISQLEKEVDIKNLISSFKDNSSFVSWLINWLMESWKYIFILLVISTVIDYFIKSHKKREQKMMISLIDLELKRLENPEN